MWICIAILTIQFLGAGVTKLTGAWSSKFAGWGYSTAFMYAIGTIEIIGVVGLFISRTRKWSTVLLILIMAGAAYTHISNLEYGRVIHNAIVAGLSFLVMHLDRKSLSQLPSNI